MATVLVHWLSWYWFFLSGYNVIDFLHDHMRYPIGAISGCKLNVLRLCVAALLSYDTRCSSHGPL
jgi:hypothetical protein